jgi:hypothetical protein
MTRRPWVVALLLAAGVMALVYNAKVYSELFAEPKPEAEAPVVIERPDPQSDAGERAASEEDAETPVPELAPLAQAGLDTFLASLPRVARDPFRFASEAVAATDGAAVEPASATPRIEGVLIGEGRRVAFIAGRARSEGEEVAGHVIVRIEPGRVVLAFQGREIEVEAPR